MKNRSTTRISIIEQTQQRLAAVVDGMKPIGTPRRKRDEESEHISETNSEQDKVGLPPVELLNRPRSFEKRHFIALLVMFSVAAVGALLWFGQAKATTIPMVSTAPSVSVPVVAKSPVPSTRSRIFIHVLGAVKHPGVVELPVKSRVQAAIKAAGGLLPDGDLAQLNLAAPIIDGSQIIIGTKANPRGELKIASSDAAAMSQGTKTKVNLNSADVARLQQLPGIGPALAKSILNWRNSHHKFTRIEELQEIDGIGTKKFAKLAPLVEV